MSSSAFFLDFEAPLADLHDKIETLRVAENESPVDLSNAIDSLMARSTKITEDLYAKLTPWQIVQVSRHPRRPYTLDYISLIFTDFQELHGDRMFSDDLSIVGGLARLNGKSCMLVGHQKGRDTKERRLRNYGYPRPEGYRKALRLMKLAEKFGLPLFTFIDTAGAWPGIDAEERGQSEAIGRNLFEMASLQIPIVSTVIGEGGSGGALAIGLCDTLNMLQYATYSVISPEACSSILWRNTSRQEDAAASLGLTAHRLKALNLIDKIIIEPLGGAHRNPIDMAASIKRTLLESLRQLESLDIADLLERRHERVRNMGVYRELSE